VTGLDVALILLAVFGIVASVALIMYVHRTPRTGAGALVGERVVVQTKDDRSLRGVLVGMYRDCLVVGHFEYLNEAADVEVAGLPGEATVMLDNLSWVHKLGAGD
jgi:hypothetical protein